MDNLDTLEPDFFRFYPALDILDFFRGKISTRRARVLISSLPPESLTIARLRPVVDPDAPPKDSPRNFDEPWSKTDQLLADLIDHVREQSWLIRFAWLSENGKKPDPPKPMSRPWVGDPPPPPPATWSDVASFINQY